MAILNDCLELFKGLFGLFLTGFMVCQGLFGQFYGQFKGSFDWFYGLI